MRLDSLENIEDIYNRIQEILSIEKKFLPKMEAKLSSSKPEFLKELEEAGKPSLENPSNSKETESNSFEPKKTESRSVSKPKPFLSRNYLSQVIEKEAKKKGLDPDLVKAIVKAESNFNPKAISPKGARGLMQLMPDTAEDLGITNPFDPIQNIKGGTSYLKELSRVFRNRDHIIAAYNAGPGAVKKYGGIPPYEETQNYVRKVNEFLEDFKED
ncbi:MAG: lytic transglycosylase domain-containing protein [Leptospiraceae bacterium]|nr:lytic transglycosylase domain-containing protein [Leptospiraceae bacterium]